MAEIKLVDTDPTSEKPLCFGDLNRGDIFRFACHSTGDDLWCMKGNEKTESNGIWYMVLKSGIMGSSYNCEAVVLLPKDKSIQITQ